MSHPNRIENAAEALAFIKAGKAVFTLVSTKTAARFTFKVSAKDDAEPDDAFRFVALKTGPETRDFSYMGVMTENGFRSTAKSRITSDAPSAKAFAWTLTKLAAGTIPESLEIWHEGRCGRCARQLTVPESIKNGIGPECIKHVGGSSFVASFLGF